MDKNQLVKQPVPKLFFHYLLPAIYILADTIIIGKGIGTEAMAALNIVLPVFNLVFGTGLLFGVGGSVLMSISRGRGEEKRGQQYFTTAFILNLLAGFIYIALFLPLEKKLCFFWEALLLQCPTSWNMLLILPAAR